MLRTHDKILESLTNPFLQLVHGQATNHLHDELISCATTLKKLYAKFDVTPPSDEQLVEDILTLAVNAIVCVKLDLTCTQDITLIAQPGEANERICNISKKLIDLFEKEVQAISKKTKSYESN